MHFIHLEFNEALNFNKLVVFVVPFLGYLWIDAFRSSIKILKENNFLSKP